MYETFPYPCSNGVSSFFHRISYFTSFIEGWALYGENPVLSDDIDLYKDNLLQKVGMYKWLVSFSKCYKSSIYIPMIVSIQLYIIMIASSGQRTTAAHRF